MPETNNLKVIKNLHQLSKQLMREDPLSRDFKIGKHRYGTHPTKKWHLEITDRHFEPTIKIAATTEYYPDVLPTHMSHNGGFTAKELSHFMFGMLEGLYSI